jgi:hypothetical protein
MVEGSNLQAAESLAKAEAYDPKDVLTKYYLMLCYSRIEKPPYGRDSLTIGRALQVISLAPGTDMAGKARNILAENEKSRIQKMAAKMEEARQNDLPPARNRRVPLVEPLPKETKAGQPPAKAGDAEPSYPQADMGRVMQKRQEASLRLAGEERAEAGAAKGDGARESQSISLSGSITRPDEKGKYFNPSGVELTLLNLTGSEIYRTSSGKDGVFSFSGIVPSGSYVLVAISRLGYTDYVREYYPYYTGGYYPGPYYDLDPRKPRSHKDPKGRRPRRPGTYVPHRDATDKPPAGAGRQAGQARPDPLRGQATRIWVGGGYIYYPPTVRPTYDNYSGYYYDYQRPVDRDASMSWHLRMKLDRPGDFQVDLNRYNADREFLDETRPRFSPITMKPFDQLTEVTPYPARPSGRVRR